ncbi:MAG: flavin monoamine oxidase family protein [Gammaproteobacteria bacterium]
MKPGRTQAITRRSFVGALGAGGFSLGMSRYARTAEKANVIVLGAGLAGLHTSMLLEELGFSVTLLEASTHVGGRVRTKNIGGTLHELGASDIGVMYARVLDIMQRLNLERVPSSIRIKPFSYHVRGKLLHADEWESSDANLTVGEERGIVPSRIQSQLLNLHNPLTELDDWLAPEHRSLDIPIGTLLRQRGVSEEAIRLFGQAYNGIGVGRTSALQLFRDTTRTRFGMNAWRNLKEAGRQVPPLSQIRGGNQRLPEAMAASLKTEIRFGKVAAAIEHGPGGVDVSCVDGSRYRGDILVMALPLTAMRRISISPSLSPEKAAASSEMRYYAVTKFYLRAKTRFWEADGYDASMWTDGPVERVFAGTDDSGDVHSLLVWITGQGSQRIDQFDRERASRIVLDTLARIRPASKGQLEVMHYHSWGRTAYIGGCGHTYSAGQVGRFAQALPAPEGRIHFAGEHTRRREFGMESALASAERVAGEILAFA